MRPGSPAINKGVAAMDDKIELKTADLTGPALDWSVAHATKAWEWAHEWYPTMTLDPTFRGVSDNAPGGHVSLIPRNPMRQDSQQFAPSTDWAQGGRLVEGRITALMQEGAGLWWAHAGDRIGYGSAPLIAACRAIVAANLGDDVQVPVWLVQESECVKAGQSGDK